MHSKWLLQSLLQEVHAHLQTIFQKLDRLLTFPGDIIRICFP